jgi:hypothetical protein
MVSFWFSDFRVAKGGSKGPCAILLGLRWTLMSTKKGLVLLDNLFGVARHLNFHRPHKRLHIQCLADPGVLLHSIPGAITASLVRVREDLLDLLNRHTGLLPVRGFYEQHVVLDHVQEVVEILGAVKV